MSLIDEYIDKVHNYWIELFKFRNVGQSLDLKLDEAIKVIEETKNAYIDTITSTKHFCCLNYGITKGDITKASNLFLIKDYDNPYPCECGESELYYVYLPDGVTPILKDTSVIVPSAESVQFVYKYLIKSEFIPGVVLETDYRNGSYVLQQDYKCICPKCGKLRSFVYDETFGLMIQ